MRVRPTEIINQIRQNLHDRYRKGFPVIKELVQNADDAGAMCFHIGWTRGLSQARHPLLQGPALFMANDGKFTGENATAINSIGLSRKEGFSIGKFGLGLKSVFHLCEAFFFLAFDNQIGRRWDGIVNPWAEWVSERNKDKFHSGWDEFHPEDREALEACLRPVLGAGCYFCMWIPLRQERHCQECQPITPDYPGDSDTPPPLFSDNLELHLADFLPLLRCIKDVKGWLSNGPDKPPEMVFQVRLIGQQLRPDTIEPGKTLALGGKIETCSSPGDALNSHHFSGSEARLANPEFEELKESGKWPIHHDTDEETGAYKGVRDRAEPHCAVCFAKYSVADQQGKLKISQAVFLPVDEPGNPFDSILCPGDADFCLTLHGFFFIDPGRTHVEGWDTNDFSNKPRDEQSLRKAWNGLLAQRGTLPLILPALDRFVKQTNLSAQEKQSLTEALAKSKLFKNPYRQHICREHQWVYCVTAEGEEWRLLSTEDPVLEILRPPASAPDRPRLVFPEITSIQHITYRDSPRLSGSNQPSSWSEQQLLKTLNLDAKLVFEGQGNLEYLVTFLEGYAGEAVHSPQISDQLCKLAQTAFQSVDLTQLRRYKGLVQRFLNFIPPKKRLAIQYYGKFSKSPILPSVVANLVELELDVLFVPDGFDSRDRPGDARLTVEDAVSILEILANPRPEWDESKDLIDLRAEIAWQMIAATSEQDALLRRCGDLKLFKGWDWHTGQKAALSLNELNQILDRRMLFSFAQPPTPHGLAAQLQNTVRNARVVLVKGDEMVNELSRRITPCNPNACIQTLLTYPVLADAKERIELLSSLLSQVDLDNQDNRRCLRYLLHGRGLHFYSDAPLLVRGTTDNQEMWARLVEHVSRLRDSAWRMVPKELAERLNNRHRRELGVEEINRESAENLLLHVGPERIDIAFGRDERDILLREIQSDDVLRWLPIHEDVDGQLVSIGDDTYLESDFDIGTVLRMEIVLLREHHHPNLAFRQSQLAPKLTPQAAIRIALSQQHPQDHWGVIMNALSRLGSVSELGQDILTALKEENWLLTQDGKYVSSMDVIYIRGLEDSIERLVATLGGTFVGERALCQEIRDHPAFPSPLVELFPSSQDALTILGTVMAEDEKYRVGPIGNLGDEDFGDFLTAFQEATELMPACQLIKAVVEELSFDECRDHLLKELFAGLSKERLVDILNFLSGQHKKVSVRQKGALRKVYGRYLKVSADHSSFSSFILPQIKLLNRRGDWKSPKELCSERQAFGIVDDYLLDDEQEKVIPVYEWPEPVGYKGQEKAVDEAQEDLEQRFKDSVQKLREYFRDWTMADDEVIGGFLCLLGDHPEVIELAKSFLGVRHVKQTRDLLGWQPIDDTPLPTGGKRGGAGQSVHEVMSYQRYLVEIEDKTETMLVPSLLGNLFWAQRRPESELEHLFIGDRPITCEGRKGDFQVNRLRLAKIHPGTFSPKQLSNLLRESARQILSRIYEQPASGLDDAWEKLEHSEQLDIIIAQRLLLDSAFFYLRQLGLHTHKPIGRILKEWEEESRRRAQEEEQGAH